MQTTECDAENAFRMATRRLTLCSVYPKQELSFTQRQNGEKKFLDLRQKSNDSVCKMDVTITSAMQFPLL